MTAIRQLSFVVVLALVAALGCGSSQDQIDAAVSDSFGPTFGAHCGTSADCAGGLCVDTPSGGVCTYTCDGSCPENWNCRLHDVDGELESICVPQQFDYCTACTSDAQCGGGVCVALGGTSACLAECPFHGTCPTGYSCGADPSGQHPGSYCIPTTATCSCTVAEQNQVRTCTKTNAFGTCRGVETCDADAGGWIGCSAVDATAESCDGLDNDCDQLIDEGVDGRPCTNTLPNVGTCGGVTRCAGAAGETCDGPMPKLEQCNYLDDDCDSSSDEVFPGVSSVCSVGIGSCQRTGVTRCNSGGTGTECSVSAGSPVAEKCNALDDDCDTKTDETFTTLGNSCTAGVGTCARQGNLVCNAAQTGTTCSVAAGTPASSDTCNGLDDDCDNKTDEGYRNQATGQYDQPFACGSCAIDCTVLYNLPNATGTCVVNGTPQCGMVCNANSFNLDGQVATGCELVLDTGAVYVSTDDALAVDDASCGLGPVGTGAGRYPCKTITQGITRAGSLNRPRVLVANGIYPEAVTLANGRSVLGGYRADTWVRDVASTSTYITGAAPIAATNHDYTVRATNVTSATVFEGFVVVGSINNKTSGNSYAIYVASSNASLAIQNNIVFAGYGGLGANGSAGANGSVGVNGVGRASNPTGYDAKQTNGDPCNATNDRAYTNGGALTCGTNNVSGGNGGGNRCAPAINNNKFSARDGAAGGAGAATLGGAAGASGEAGFDMELDDEDTCFLGTGADFHDYGYDGGNGGDGMPGTMVAGCNTASGSVVGGHWTGGAGVAGVAGGNGGGGGGGGAGGGAACVNCPTAKDELGGHGGGGGSGGCGGTGGGAPTAGGGAFAIFVAGGTAPVITGNDLRRGQGAGGGRGGGAGSGGYGGSGADGGRLGTLFCPGVAGRGGSGGNGGHGSGGGGACGGSSYGIYTSGVGTPNYCTGTANNTISGGAAGAGGAGGYSLVNPGGAGAAGALLDCSFN